jgi:putative NADH-flavin reductase
MKLTVFAPAGSTGEQFVRPALAADHEVTAVALRPDAVAPADLWLRVLAGDVLDPASPRDGVAGYDIEPGLNKQEPYVV